MLDVKPRMLSYQLYKKSKSTLYTKFQIPKRSGGTREICAPEKGLKLIQYRLSLLLQNCVDEINTAKFPSAFAAGNRFGIAHGFKPKHSILTNGQKHKRRRYVFNVDLHDFFGCINFGRIRGFFISDKNFLLSPPVATVIAQIACFENKLPQGSPCSPIISNLIGHILDIHLVRLAAATGCTYTRYADDLTFSTNKQVFPSRLAITDTASNHSWVPGDELTRLVVKSGFRINAAKTRMQYMDSRQEVTGLSVNRRVNSRKDYRNLVRAMVDRLCRTGSFEQKQEAIGPNSTKTKLSVQGNPSELAGMLSFIDLVDRFNDGIHKAVKPVVAAPTGRAKLYRQFYIFDKFFTTRLPVILCEGPSDSVYLSHAIRRLVGEFPGLSAVDAKGKHNLKVSLHNYSKANRNRILNLSGGTGQLASFIVNYKQLVSTKFKAPLGGHPIIVLIDNDSGRTDFISQVKKATKVEIDSTADFVHIAANLYVVLTPLIHPNQDSYIELCFDESTRAIQLNGKTFSPLNKFDTSINYGKIAFAKEVIRPKSNEIDFSGFLPLLNRLQQVIADYVIKISPSA